MFALENFVYNFKRKLNNVFKSEHPTKLKAGNLMLKYNQILLDRYSDTTFLLRQITKQYQPFHHAWIHISNHLNMVNNTMS